MQAGRNAEVSAAEVVAAADAAGRCAGAASSGVRTALRNSRAELRVEKLPQGVAKCEGGAVGGVTTMGSLRRAARRVLARVRGGDGTTAAAGVHASGEAASSDDAPAELPADGASAGSEPVLWCPGVACAFGAGCASGAERA